ncbi:MAG: hypothetical protein OXC48_04365 [Endozoicomonadaceae bacterium]|nr:hypothetical protein [Endozoicomonadaceae bacterium]
MLTLLLISLFVYVTFVSLAWVRAKARHALFWSDLAAPIVIVSFWMLLAEIGYGHQSLAHIIEIPLALLCSVVALNIRVFIIDKYKKNYLINSYITLSVCVVIVFLLRTCMPFMPE